jgi:hypothetical protein
VRNEEQRVVLGVDEHPAADGEVARLESERRRDLIPGVDRSL